MKQRRDILWSVSGHGGTERPHEVPQEDPEIVRTREELRRAEAEFYFKQAELRKIVTKRERNNR